MWLCVWCCRWSDHDALIARKTWLTGNVSKENIVGDMTTAGNPVHRVARTHLKGVGVAIVFRDSLKFETPPPALWEAKPFENHQLTYISGELNVHVVNNEWLHPTKKNTWKVSSNNFWNSLTLATISRHMTNGCHHHQIGMDYLCDVIFKMASVKLAKLRFRL